MADSTRGMCVWREDCDGEMWSTDCGKGFTLIEDTPAENGMRYCCFCGRALVQLQEVEPEITEVNDVAG